jgi:single-strand DNA-binding protein
MQNIVILAGNIGQDPETRSTTGGTKITHLTIATSRPRYAEGKPVRDDKRPNGTASPALTAWAPRSKSIAARA